MSGKAYSGSPINPVMTASEIPLALHHTMWMIPSELLAKAIRVFLPQGFSLA